MENAKIFKAIADTMNDVSAVGKNSKNEKQNYNFRGIDAVMNALHPAMVKNRIFVVPEVLDQQREERQSKNGKLIYSICKIKYTFFADDGSNISAITKYLPCQVRQGKGGIEYLYRGYHALGGNGTGTELYERVKELKLKEEQNGKTKN